MKNIILVLMCLSTSVFALDFSRYHTQKEIGQYMRDLEKEYPGVVKFYKLGESDEKREIAYITLTKGSESLPAIYFNGTHHGDEWSSTEGILGLIDHLIKNQNDPQVSKLLTSYVFYLQPIINPDGHQHEQREDAKGADPNRDYLYPGGSSNSQFKTVIIPLVRKLMDSRKFRAAAAYHSGIEEVLYPWCYSSAATNQKDLFYTLAKKAATAMKMNRVLQSYFDYPTNGEFIDYAFHSQGTLALTYEVSTAKTPSESQLPFIVKRSVDGALAFINAVNAYDQGRLQIESAPTWTLAESMHPLWKALGMKLE